MKKILFIVSILFTFSCSKEFQEDIVDYGMDPTVKISGDGKYDLLGHGYDLTKRHYNPEDGMMSVINIGALLKANSENILPAGLAISNEKLMVANNRVEYTQNLTKKAGLNIGNLFKGSIEQTQDISGSMAYSYASFNLDVRHKRYKITLNPENLSPYLTSRFKEDILRESPQFIVKQYGTHVLTDIVIGGKVEIMYQTFNTSKNINKKKVVAAGAKIAIKKIFNIDPSYDETYNSSLSRENSKEYVTYKSIGGDPTIQLSGSINIGTNNTVNLEKWKSSCNFDSYPNRARLIDAYEPIPIWEFIEDPIKKATVKNYILNYIKENQYLGNKVRLTHISESRYKSLHTLGLHIYKETNKYVLISAYLPFGEPISGQRIWEHVGYMFSDYVEGTVPLFHFYRRDIDDHTYTTDFATGVNHSHYNFVEIYGYVYENPGSNRNKISRVWAGPWAQYLHFHEVKLHGNMKVAAKGEFYLAQ